MSGPAPTPTRLKLVRGNPGKRKINKKEPKPKKQLGACPMELGRYAKALWKELEPELVDVGLWKKLYGPAFKLLCEIYQTMKEAETDVKSKGKYTEVQAKSGDLYYQVAPWWTVLQKSRDQFRYQLASFGLDPSAASRVSVSEPEKEEDPFAAYEGKR